MQKLLKENFYLMAAGVVILVPVAEETFYRGLIFGGLYSRSKATAYVVSSLLFSAIHVLGYIGSYEPVHLLLCFLQYLPAAYCLNFAYRYGGTILAPIFMHMLTNLFAISIMR